jgi:hypothetical protein
MKLIDALALMHEYGQSEKTLHDWEKMCHALAPDKTVDLCVLGLHIVDNELCLTGRDREGNSLLANADLVGVVPAAARSLLVGMLALFNVVYEDMHLTDVDGPKHIISALAKELHGWCATRGAL